LLCWAVHYLSSTQTFLTDPGACPGKFRHRSESSHTLVVSSTYSRPSSNHDVHDQYQSEKRASKKILSPVRNPTALSMSTTSKTARGFPSIGQNLVMSPQPLKGKRLSDIKLKTRLFGGVTINARTVVAPLFAFTMAGLLFVYSRTSIQAAKRNAKSHRIADGGQISWYLLPCCLMTSVNLFGRPLVYKPLKLPCIDWA